MTPSSNPLRDVVALMRPAQWPILSAQFFVGVLLVAPAAQGGGCWLNSGSLLVLAAAWLSWVVLLNGGTLAFNSSQDRDEGPIAYLPAPPPPPRGLAGLSLGTMGAGALLGAVVVGPVFGSLTALCVVLSVLYSHPAVRAKSLPGVDLVVNMVGYGAATTAAGVLAGRAAYLIGPAAGPPAPNAQLAIRSTCGIDRWFWPQLPAGDAWSDPVPLADAVGSGGVGWIVLAFGLLFGSLYPLTQIYQLDEDRERGDRTLATALGVSGSLRLAMLLGILAAIAIRFGLLERGAGALRFLPLAAVLAWTGHLLLWHLRTPGFAAPDHERGMYRALNLWALVDVALLVAWFLR